MRNPKSTYNSKKLTDFCNSIKVAMSFNMAATSQTHSTTEHLKYDKSELKGTISIKYSLGEGGRKISQ